jgi:glycosyltransferase involved in cell wall biosynthesis
MMTPRTSEARSRVAVGTPPLTTTCLVNHFNYGRFVGEAIESALAQTVPFDEIVVVDDGSSPEDVEALRAACDGQDRVRLILKENGGQLSCFNEGFVASSGDVVFFLDADDLFETDYVENALRIYASRPDVGFVFCNPRIFGPSGVQPAEIEPDHDFGDTVLLARYRRKWIGAPTSCLSMRREVLRHVLPVPDVKDWKTRADDCLVLGASLAGARKYRIGRPLVRYRVHGDNLFSGRSPEPWRLRKREQAIDRLIPLVLERSGHRGASLADVPREFRSLGKRTLRDYRRYLQIVRRAPGSLYERVAAVTSVTWAYLFG